MRILLLTPDPPAGTHINGGTTRQYHLYKRLIELGHEVVVVGPLAAHAEPFEEGLRADGFETHFAPRPKSRLVETLRAAVKRPGILLGIFRSSFQVLAGSVYWVDLKPIARRLLTERDFDVICVEQEFAAPWIDGLAPETRKVLISQQVESAYAADRAARRNGLGRALAKIDARRAAANEREWTPRFDAVVCMSEAEIELLREVVGELPPAYAVTNGADLSWLAGVGPDPGEQRVLFTGTMAFGPNAVGAEWLAREVWPHVLESEPQATLDIVGRDPGPATVALGELDGVTVHGAVPDMLPFFEAASVCTLPMLEGGGTRLKLAEAFGAGRAVVSTTNGATGIDVTAGAELAIADSPDDFAGAIVRLLHDDEERARLAAAGREFAQRELDWQKLGDRFEQVLRAVSSGQA